MKALTAAQAIKHAKAAVYLSGARGNYRLLEREENGVRETPASDYPTGLHRVRVARVRVACTALGLDDETTYRAMYRVENGANWQEVVKEVTHGTAKNAQKRAFVFSAYTVGLMRAVRGRLRLVKVEFSTCAETGETKAQLVSGHNLEPLGLRAHVFAAEELDAIKARYGFDDVGLAQTVMARLGAL